LPVVLYGCETWSLTLKEEHKLWVFENRVLRRIFGPKRNEVTGEYRKLHNDELNDLYSSLNIVRVIFGPKRNEVTGEYRKLHNDELNDLYSSLNIVRVIKSSRMK